MKSKDIAIIVGIAIVAGIFSYVLSSYLFSQEKSQNLTAPTVKAISAEFPPLDERFFNSNSLNPTKTITIGESENNNPF